MSFEIHLPTNEPDKPVLPDDGYEALVRVRPELAAVADEDLHVINVDIKRACALVLGAMPAFRTLREAIVEELPKIPIDKIDKLEDYATALYYAQTMTKPRAASNERILPLYNEALPLRAELLEQANALARRGFLDVAKVAEIRGGSGFLDAANDLVSLSMLFRQNWSAVSNKTVIVQADGERADQLGRDLLALTEAPDPIAMDEAVKTRDRCFALFMEAYWTARRAVEHVRWWEGDVNRFVPSIFTKRRKRRKRNEPGPNGGAEAVPSAVGDPEGGAEGR